jgi:hypothetical protein
MFFLLFGLRTRDNVIGREWLTCEFCGFHAAQTMIKRTTKFTLFFIPLFPVKPSTHYLQCSHCGTYRRAHGRTFARLASA